MFETHEVTLHVKKYIAHPYWPEREQLVNIAKLSGSASKRTPEKREAALRLYLEKIGMSRAQYQELEARANRPFYTNSQGNIIIPSQQITSCLVQSAASAPTGSRIPTANLRSLVQVSDLCTEKTVADDKYERYVMPKDGAGKPLSNQRSLRQNEFIEDFHATGTVDIDLDGCKVETVRDLFVYAGKYIGCGASRKMGYGRFIVHRWD